MDFLLDPNIAFLFLIGGVFLAMLAVATPGTGFFEIATLFCLLLAGYALYNLPFNWWALLILMLSIVPFLLALRRSKFGILLLGVTIFLLVVGAVFLFPRTESQSGVNPIVAIVTSGSVGGFLWFAIRKSLDAAHVKPAHDLDRLVGQVGQAKTDVHEDGSVQVDGELWSARSENPIPEKSPIKVIRREGFILVVESSSSSHSL